MSHSIWNSEKYRKEGRAARAAGKPKHANPYDYVYETLAANAWEAGWEKAGNK